MKNLTIMKELTADEKCFAWKVQQEIQQEIQTMEHLFSTCESVLEIYEQLRLILNNVLQRPVSFNDIIHFSFNHRNKKKLVCALWFSVFNIFQDKSRNEAQISREIIKEIPLAPKGVLARSAPHRH